MALRNQEIGQRIRDLRGNRPQTVVADELGVSERALQNWEAGETKPAYRSLQKLAAYFRVEEEYILTGEPETRVVNGGTFRQVETPELLQTLGGETPLGDVLAAIMNQLAAQTEVLNEVKDVLVQVKAMLGKDTETADRIEAVSESLGGAAAQLDAHVRQVTSVPISDAPRKRAAKTGTAPKRTPRA